MKTNDPYEMYVQYPSIKDAIKAYAETYSFNIESELFHQLTKEQQELWRKEIEYACISGGDVGYSLAKDERYKENIEVKDIDLDKEVYKEWDKCNPVDEGMGCEFATIAVEQFYFIAKHFFELGLKQKEE